MADDHRAPQSGEAATPMNETMYFLSRDCFVCRAQDYWIILNTKLDQYFCVTNANLGSIGARLHGWQDISNVAAPSSQSQQSAHGLIESLISNGVITGARNEGKPFAECGYPAQETAVEIPRRLDSVRIPLLCIAQFFLACARIDWHLRRNDFSYTLLSIERRRLRAKSSSANHNVARISTLIAAFKKVRPLYPRPYLCLFDSLALVEFLARYSLFPQLVFGVIADPFQAHCWLQEGSVVLNDSLENVSRFKPIYSV
jgi:Transglutaminase-like superfamily